MNRSHYTLDELLAEAQAAGVYPLPPEERELVDAPAVGREISTAILAASDGETGLTDAEAERFDQLRDKTPAEPMAFDADGDQPTGTIDGFLGRHADKVKKPMTIEEMNEIATAGWAGELHDDQGRTMGTKNDDDPACSELRAVLGKRIAAGLAGQVSAKGISEILEEELADQLTGEE